MTVSKIFVSLAIVMFATAAAAETSFQFAMPGVRAPEDDTVSGFRIVFLHGKAKSVSGWDLGLASFSEAETQSGLSTSFGIARVSGNSSGCACSMMNIHGGEDTGLNLGFVNSVKSIPTGVNAGFVNITEGQSGIEINGLGMSNKSDVQIGFVNITKEITKFQVGFLNMAENGVFPILPFANWPKK